MWFKVQWILTQRVGKDEKFLKMHLPFIRVKPSSIEKWYPWEKVIRLCLTYCLKSIVWYLYTRQTQVWRIKNKSFCIEIHLDFKRIKRAFFFCLYYCICNIKINSYMNSNLSNKNVINSKFIISRIYRRSRNKA